MFNKFIVAGILFLAIVGLSTIIDAICRDIARQRVVRGLRKPETPEEKLALAEAVINKYCVVCTICNWRKGCDYDISQDCDFKWDRKSI